MTENYKNPLWSEKISTKKEFYYLVRLLVKLTLIVLIFIIISADVYLYPSAIGSTIWLHRAIEAIKISLISLGVIFILLFIFLVVKFKRKKNWFIKIMSKGIFVGNDFLEWEKIDRIVINRSSIPKYLADNIGVGGKAFHQIKVAEKENLNEIDLQKVEIYGKDTSFWMGQKYKRLFLTNSKSFIKVIKNLRKDSLIKSQ